MKRIIICIISLSLFACNQQQTKDKSLVSASNGKINSISVVIDNELWKGPIGEEIRKGLAQSTIGLPQEEPLFSLSQIPPSIFNGFVRNNRTYVQIIKGKKAQFGFTEDAYAKPQLGVVIKGETNEEIIDLFQKNLDLIIKGLHQTELAENQRRVSKSMLRSPKLKKELGISLNIPSEYRVAKTNTSTIWIRKNVKTGNMNILAYELPKNAIKQDTTLISQIIKIRDSIGKTTVQGEDDGSYMITERAFTPFIKETTVNGFKAYETRGTWEVSKQFMAGPFLNYLVEDEKNSRWIVIEGFMYAPRIEKRDHVFELEAILKTLRID